MQKKAATVESKMRFSVTYRLYASSINTSSESNGNISVPGVYRRVVLTFRRGHTVDNSAVARFYRDGPGEEIKRRAHRSIDGEGSYGLLL